MNNKAEIETTIAIILFVIVITAASIGSYFAIKDNSNSKYEFDVQPGDIVNCYGILTTYDKEGTIKWLTEMNDGRSIYPLVLGMDGACPHHWSKTYYSDEEFPNESICYEGSCLIKYENDANEVKDE